MSDEWRDEQEQTKVSKEKHASIIFQIYFSLASLRSRLWNRIRSTFLFHRSPPALLLAAIPNRLGYTRQPYGQWSENDGEQKFGGQKENKTPKRKGNTTTDGLRLSSTGFVAQISKTDHNKTRAMIGFNWFKTKYKRTKRCWTEEKKLRIGGFGRWGSGDSFCVGGWKGQPCVMSQNKGTK